MACNSIAVGTYADDHHYPGEDGSGAEKLSVGWTLDGNTVLHSYDALVSDAASNLLVAEKGSCQSHGQWTRLSPHPQPRTGGGTGRCTGSPENCPPTALSVRTLQLALIHDATALQRCCLSGSGPGGTQLETGSSYGTRQSR